MTKVYLISGAPCSGKSTFVKQHMQKGDLIFDFDEIAKALTFGELHNNNPLIKDYVIDIRNLILNRLESEYDIRAAWIIVTDPTNILNNNYYIDFEIVEMKTTKAECIERLKTNPDGRDKTEILKVIENYFNPAPKL